MSSSDLNLDWELVGSPPIAIIIGGEMIARAGACSSGGFPAHTLNKKSSACIFQLQPPAFAGCETFSGVLSSWILFCFSLRS